MWWCICALRELCSECFLGGSSYNTNCVSSVSSSSTQTHTHTVLCNNHWQIEKKKKKRRTEYCSVEKVLLQT